MTRLRTVGLALLVACVGLIAAPVRADGTQTPAASVERIWQVIDMPATLDLLREEGLEMAQGVADEYLPARRGDGWRRSVEEIFDPAAMTRLMTEGFAADFQATDPAPVIAFFDSPLGHRIIALELSARRAFLDPDTEAAARERVSSGQIPPERAALIDAFIAVNDLVSFNIQGALNTNFAFLSGLATSELFEMTEAQILDRVYGNAEETRTDTEEWLRAYLTMAYQPLDDAELEAYVAFSERPEGRRLNRALFAGFGAMYDVQYHALGLAVARQLGAQDL
ncbi:DUF2059 domain-containing protein [Pseudooceanicola sp.]|uniref:DUF2059 domain-containing protein n=1 Tax=Pseudooceanicola sp. TaxID=1914328 RepID=UPI0035C767EA